MVSNAVFTKAYEQINLRDSGKENVQSDVQLLNMYEGIFSI